METINVKLVVSPTSIHKIVLVKQPGITIDDCMLAIAAQAQQKQIHLPERFQFQYFDNDFNDFFSLTSEDQITNMCTIKVIDESVLASVPQSTLESQAAQIVTASAVRSTGQIPNTFPLPQFPASVKLVLDKGQHDYEESGTTLNLSVGLKSKFLDCLSEEIIKFKMYPSDKEFEIVAKAIVSAYPCLKSKTGVEGWEVWKASLKFKMGNMRGKMRQVGCLEALANSGKRSKFRPNLPGPKKGMKKPRRGEANYLPNLPSGITGETMEVVRKELDDIMTSTNKDLNRINCLMAATYSARRQVILDRPMVSDVMQQWPALFMKSQILAEFSRITNLNGSVIFYTELDSKIPNLVDLLRARGGKYVNYMRRRYDEMLKREKDHGIVAQREFVLTSISTYLGEKPDDFIKFYDEGTVDGELTDVEHQQIAVVGDNRVVLVIEKSIVIEETDVCDAILQFFALHYILDLQYHQCMKSTMEFIQKLIFKLGDESISSKLQNLREKLAK